MSWFEKSTDQWQFTVIILLRPTIYYCMFGGTIITYHWSSIVDRPKGLYVFILYRFGRIYYYYYLFVCLFVKLAAYVTTNNLEKYI